VLILYFRKPIEYFTRHDDGWIIRQECPARLSGWIDRAMDVREEKTLTPTWPITACLFGYPVLIETNDAPHNAE
jgi:hypothetical protein